MRMKSWALTALMLTAAACTREQAHEAKETAKQTVHTVAEKVRGFEVPLGAKEDPAEREKQRFDERWRQLQSFRAAEAARQAAQSAALPKLPQPPPTFRIVTGVKESLKGLQPAAVNDAPVSLPIRDDVSGPSVIKTQVYLDRIHFSVGPIDGRWGRNSAIAVWWYQRARGLETTGVVDEKTFRMLAGEAGYAPAVTRYTLTADDVKGPFTQVPEDVYEKAKLDCLCYESLQEKLSEKFHVTADFLDVLNPGVKFADLHAGDAIFALNVRPPLEQDTNDLAKVVVSIAGNTFNGYDANGNLIFHSPTTLGSKYDPSPDETLKVVDIARDPHFHYQPTLFHEVPDSDPEAMLNPGPNSPVGVVWIALSRAHYGIHGTSDPDSIGYASSHGCVRLTNWDAGEVSHRVRKETPVEFVDTRSSQ